MATTKPTAGCFRSEIFFFGKFYDVEWTLHLSNADGYDVHVRTIRNISDNIDLYGMPAPQADFKEHLIRRSKQIRAANNFYQ